MTSRHRTTHRESTAPQARPLVAPPRSDRAQSWPDERLGSARSIRSTGARRSRCIQASSWERWRSSPLSSSS